MEIDRYRTLVVQEIKNSDKLDPVSDIIMSYTLSSEFSLLFKELQNQFYDKYRQFNIYDRSQFEINCLPPLLNIVFINKKLKELSVISRKNNQEFIITIITSPYHKFTISSGNHQIYISDFCISEQKKYIENNSTKLKCQHCYTQDPNMLYFYPVDCAIYGSMQIKKRVSL